MSFIKTLFFKNIQTFSGWVCIILCFAIENGGIFALLALMFFDRGDSQEEFEVLEKKLDSLIKSATPVEHHEGVARSSVAATDSVEEGKL